MVEPDAYDADAETDAADGVEGKAAHLLNASYEHHYMEDHLCYLHLNLDLPMSLEMYVLYSIRLHFLHCYLCLLIHR